MTDSAPWTDADQPRFAISIGGKIYGPYTTGQLRSYIGEGRVTATSLVSRDGGPWTAAADDVFCAHILAQRARRVPETATTITAPPDAAAEPVAPDMEPVAAAEDAPGSVSSSSAREAFLKELEGVRSLKLAAGASPRTPSPPRPEEPAPAPLFPTERETASEASNFLIVFDLKSRGHNKLEEHIMALGRAVRVLPGFWMLHAAMTSGAIRNQLMKHFGAIDTLIIVDATRDKLAWFNLGPEIDSQIRQVWRRT